jgi:hypothetical protein
MDDWEILLLMFFHKIFLILSLIQNNYPPNWFIFWMSDNIFWIVFLKAKILFFFMFNFIWSINKSQNNYYITLSYLSEIINVNNYQNRYNSFIFIKKRLNKIKRSHIKEKVKSKPLKLKDMLIKIFWMSKIAKKH